MHGVGGGVSEEGAFVWAFRRADCLARFESVYNEEVVQSLYSVEVELR
jgi:hypothetical protein